MSRKAALVTIPTAAANDAATSVVEMVYLNTLLKLPEACAEARTSLKTLQRAERAGRLKVLPYGARGKRIRRSDLLAWEEAGSPTDKIEP